MRGHTEKQQPWVRRRGARWERGTGQEEEGCQPRAHMCVRQGREGHRVGEGNGEAELHRRGAARKAGGEVTFGQAWEEAGPPGGQRDARPEDSGTAEGGAWGPGGTGAKRPREAEPRLEATAGLWVAEGEGLWARREGAAGFAATDRARGSGLSQDLGRALGRGFWCLEMGRWRGGWEHSPQACGAHIRRSARV